ncbi:MAG: PEP/pyruvate-binding domain-containing protein [Chloroflexota bacterium]
MTTGQHAVEKEVIWKPLADLGLDDLPIAGGKAARLGHLAHAGFRVPDGFVVLAGAHGRTDAVREAIRAGLMTLGPGRVAVRSSGTQEDLAEASFAGQYESVLDVAGEDEVMAAVVTCWESAGGDRVRSYSDRRTGGSSGPMAVLIQTMVDARSAGVAYSVNPVTGARDEVTISAVRGLGERLVSGTADPDEWIVRVDQPALRSGKEAAIDAGQALEIADLARRVAERLGAPQDIEWATSDGGLFLLQARPMTGLPDDVRWDCPLPGGFARHFRFGEWIGDPVTPLFESWLLTELEDALHAEFKVMTGLTIPRPSHVVVNGWYFYATPAMPENPIDMARMLPPVLAKLLVQPRRVAMMMPPTAHFGVEIYVKEWRELGLPRYLDAVATAQSRLESLNQRELIGLIDELGREAGKYFMYVTAVAGYAAKAEMPLGKFYKEHLHPRIGGSHLDLLQGLVETVTIEPHAVSSLDWYFPTVGELGSIAVDGGADQRRARLRAARTEAEGRAREALATQPKLAKTFAKLLAAAQRFQPLREECVSHLTRSWPLMRGALARIADELVAGGKLSDPTEIHFLTRDELLAAANAGSGPFPTNQRRATWQGQRRLSPPLIIGKVPPLMQKVLDDFAEATRIPSEAPGLRGLAASPGRATGPVQVIRDVSEFGRLRPGDVLVAPATTPAWTPLFATAVAVVTDTGSLGSHASQVAREYGIPAVVCTGDATRQLQTGQVVTVDGNAGLVEVSPAG